MSMHCWAFVRASSNNVGVEVGKGVAVGVGEGSGVQVGSGVHVGTVVMEGCVGEGSGAQVRMEGVKGCVGSGSGVAVTVRTCGVCGAGVMMAAQPTKLACRMTARINRRKKNRMVDGVCKAGTSLRKGRWHFAVVANSRRKARKEARRTCHALVGVTPDCRSWSTRVVWATTAPQGYHAGQLLYIAECSNLHITPL